MKNPWLIGCGVAGVAGVVLCGGLAFLIYSGVSAIFAMTQPVVDASNGFLGLVGQGKIAEAYASTAAGFRAQQDEASFTEAVQKLGLTDFTAASWNSRKINNSDGSVEGTAATKNGGSTPVAVQLVFEQGAWKVVGVRWGGVDLAALKQSRPAATVPPEAELRRLATETLLDFNQAVLAGDFTAFHRKASAQLRQQRTPEEMAKAFQAFIDGKADISSIKGLDPVFDAPPAIDDQGVLKVSGRYPARPSPVKFTLRYVSEPPEWKLLGIKVDVGDGH